MTNISQDFDRLFNHLNQVSIGFVPLFRDFTHSSNSYPPHNIYVLNDFEFNIELAVAGFKKNEISIQEENGILSITADKDNQEAVADAASYQYRGIAKRAFSKSFRIAEHFEIKEAKLEDGILTIKYKRDQPISKPKLIAIS